MIESAVEDLTTQLEKTLDFDDLKRHDDFLLKNPDSDTRARIIVVSEDIKTVKQELKNYKEKNKNISKKRTASDIEVKFFPKSENYKKTKTIAGRNKKGSKKEGSIKKKTLKNKNKKM
jgi:hypothetical protein